jgi:hypothetical protein
VILKLITSKKDYLKLIAAHIPLAVMSVIYCIYTIIPQHDSMYTFFSSAYNGQGFVSFDIVKDIKLFLSNILNKIFVLLMKK